LGDELLKLDNFIEQFNQWYYEKYFIVFGYYSDYKFLQADYK